MASLIPGSTLRKCLLTVFVSFFMLFCCLSPPDIAFAVGSPAEEPVIPVTWEVSAEHPMIDTDEARALYKRIRADDYPTIDELRNDHVVRQLDALSSYYSALYGDTSRIDTPEREQLRTDILNRFMARGSARLVETKENGSKVYAYDGPLKYDYQCVIVTGLPASGKSTKVLDPGSQMLGAFIVDSDVIKEMLPEFIASHGAAAESVHKESSDLRFKALKSFTEGDKKGCNVFIQTIGHDLEVMEDRLIKPFEAAGYNVKVVLVDMDVDISLARAVMRGLSTGRIIKSQSILDYGEKPRTVYNALAPRINSCGETYGFVAAPAEAAMPNTYVVVKGDTLTKIAKQHNTTVDDLVKLNGIKDPNLIYVGQTIKFAA